MVTTGLWGEDAIHSQMSWEHFLEWTLRLIWKAGESTETTCATAKRKQQTTEKGKHLEPLQEIQTSSKGSKAAAITFG